MKMIYKFLACVAVATTPVPSMCNQFEKIAHDANGRVGVAIMLLESGSAVDFIGDERFPMHSVYKLPIAMAVFRRVDEGQLKLDQMIKIEKSDFVRQGMYSPLRDNYPDGVQI